MKEVAFQKLWKKFLIDIDKSETDIAKETGQAQQTLNKKIKNASIRYIELSEIVEKYGYNIDIKKTEE